LRETLFNVLGQSAEGWRVLDGFAGTGALGLEALSRGATHVTFVERDRHALDVLTKNVQALSVEDACAIIRDDFERWHARDTFDLVLLDPPYDHPVGDVEAALAAAAAGWLAEGWTVVLTRATRSSTLVIPVHWRLAKRLGYGDTSVLILESDRRPS